MKNTNVVSWGLFAVAALSMIAALVPLVKAGPINVVFLGVAVVFFALGIVMARKAGERRD
jgi:hypothetical protein